MQSNYVRCSRCHEYEWAPCRCSPFELAQAWQGKVEDDDWKTVWGKDPEALVERWAQRYDSNGEYSIVGGSPQEVWVRDGDTVTKWEVVGETVPEYHARRLPDPTEAPRT